MSIPCSVCLPENFPGLLDLQLKGVHFEYWFLLKFKTIVLCLRNLGSGKDIINSFNLGWIVDNQIQ